MTNVLQPLLRQLTSRRIHLSAPDVGQVEEDLLVDALRSGWVAPLGPHVDAFEQELGERAGRRHVVALSSGTAALHLGLLELGARPGTVVIVPTMTFVATANAVTYTGATPVFVDCDPHSGNLDPELLETALAELASEGVRVAAVVTVDLLGKCADYDAVLPICARAGVPVLEDAAEALGAEQSGRPAGSFGDCAVLSFNGNKIITTSGGGALLTDDAHLASRVRYLSTQARQPVTHYEHTETGYNYRLSNLLAAVGRGQLQRLDELIEKRQRLRELYVDLFAGQPGVEIFQRGSVAIDATGVTAAPDADDNCWLTAILVDQETSGWAPAELAKVLAAENIEARPLWKPMHQQPLFSGSRSFLNGASDRLFERGLTLPSGSSLSSDDVDRVCTAVTAFLADQRSAGARR